MLYYQAIQTSTGQTDCAPFIAFMLTMIGDALRDNLAPQVSPQVGALLDALHGEMSREQLQAALGLADRKSFQQRYLLPALQAGWIERTLPDKPRSRLQKYRLAERGALALAALRERNNGGGR